jgi:hypothetical protein
MRNNLNSSFSCRNKNNLSVEYIAFTIIDLWCLYGMVSVFKYDEVQKSGYEGRPHLNPSLGAMDSFFFSCLLAPREMDVDLSNVLVFLWDLSVYFCFVQSCSGLLGTERKTDVWRAVLLAHRCIFK